LRDFFLAVLFIKNLPVCAGGNACGAERLSFAWSGIIPRQITVIVDNGGMDIAPCPAAAIYGR
jgi:hypothetical protein